MILRVKKAPSFCGEYRLAFAASLSNSEHLVNLREIGAEDVDLAGRGTSSLRTMRHGPRLSCPDRDGQRNDLNGPRLIAAFVGSTAVVGWASGLVDHANDPNLLSAAEPARTCSTAIRSSRSAAIIFTASEPPSKRVASIPADLEAVVLRCLAKNPADRFASMEVLRDALDACACAIPFTQG